MPIGHDGISSQEFTTQKKNHFGNLPSVVKHPLDPVSDLQLMKVVSVMMWDISCWVLKTGAMLTKWCGWKCIHIERKGEVKMHHQPVIYIKQKFSPNICCLVTWCAIKYNIHIWQVSGRQYHQILTWFKRSDKCHFRIRNISNTEINYLFHNPNPGLDKWKKIAQFVCFWLTLRLDIGGQIKFHPTKLQPKFQSWSPF